MSFSFFDPQTIVGHKVGAYEVQKYITQGGMAHVYQAYDAGLERKVAVKILLPEFTRDRNFVERFRREARAAAQLRHPNIVQIYATGATEENLPYIVMEYVEGGALDQKLEELAQGQTVFTAAHALAIIRQLADALAAAHRAGVIHRDIKPANVLLKGDGTPVLTDLGIAVMQNDPRLTRANALIGTPDYMSPEQAQGEQVDGRSDLYSLGVILYELLAGRRPFVAESPWAIIHKHLYEEAVPLKKIRKGLSPQTYEVAHTCLQKKPDARFQTAEQLVSALDQALLAEGTGGHISDSGVWTWAKGAGGLYTGQKGTVRSANGKRTWQWWYLALPALLIPFFFLAFQRVNQGQPALPSPTLTAVLPVSASAQADANEADEIALEATSTLRPTPVGGGVEEEELVSTETPTATPTATSTPTLRPTRTPAATPSATATATRRVGAASAGGGLPLNFTSFGVWVRGDEPYGTFVQSSERSRSGGFSGKLTYNFPASGNNYVVFMQLNDISGEPTALQVWVYGDGSGHYLNAWILDAGGQTWQTPFGRVTHTGWRQMTAYIDVDQNWPWTHISGPNNGQVDYPIRFRAFVLDDYAPSSVTEGVIYIDDLTATTLAPSDSSPPHITVTPTPSGVGPSTVTPTPTPAATIEPGSIGRILYTSGNTIMTTDPDWSAPVEIGTAARNTCGGSAATVSGETFNLYRGPFCSIGDTISTCRSPNGQHEVVVQALDPHSVSIVVRPISDPDNSVFIYQGSINRSVGIRWSPLSSVFNFSVGDTLYQAFPAGGYNEIISIAYEPVFSPDGGYILYRRPVGPGINDVFVSDANGANQRNVTNVQSIDKRCAAWRQ